MLLLIFWQSNQEKFLDSRSPVSGTLEGVLCLGPCGCDLLFYPRVPPGSSWSLTAVGSWDYDLTNLGKIFEVEDAHG